MPRPWRLPAFLAAGLVFAVPAAAQSPTDGQWQCRRDGTPVGTLAVAGTTYAFGSSRADDPATGSGTLAMKAGVLTVESGPLLDAMGLVSATLSGTSLDMTLAFAGPAAAIACGRR